jgi:hypothetical protein
MMMSRAEHNQTWLYVARRDAHRHRGGAPTAYARTTLVEGDRRPSWAALVLIGRCENGSRRP